MFRETGASVIVVFHPGSCTGVLLPNMFYADVMGMRPPEGIDAGMSAKTHDDRRRGQRNARITDWDGFLPGNGGVCAKKRNADYAGTIRKGAEPIMVLVRDHLLSDCRPGPPRAFADANGETQPIAGCGPAMVFYCEAVLWLPRARVNPGNHCREERSL